MSNARGPGRVKTASAAQRSTPAPAPVRGGQARPPPAYGVARVDAAKPTTPNKPRKRDLSDPAYARAVMELLSPEERAKLRTKADYEWAIQNYESVMAIRATLGPSPEPLKLTPPTLDVHAPAIVAEQARDRAQLYAGKQFARQVYLERGLDPALVDDFDERDVAALVAQFSDDSTATSPLANDALGDSKGPVNHLLDGVEHGLFKVGHDVGNIGLSIGFGYDALTSTALPEEPEWFGAAGRTRGQTQSLGGLAWELAGNIPLIGQAQLLYGATELARGAYKGDWNNVAYGVGNIAGSLMFGGALGKAPLKPGKFGDTRIGRAYESTRSSLSEHFSAPARDVGFRSRLNPAHLLPSGELPTHVDVPSHAPGAPYSSKLASGTQVEVDPHLVGTSEPVLPDLANRMHGAAKAVEALLPKGRKLATPEGQPLKIVFDPSQPVPYLDRASGTVHMNPGLDPHAPLPSSGPGAEMARWAPDGHTTPSEVVMHHELGHAAMPEIGARITDIGKRKLTRAFMKRLGLAKDTPETRLGDARLAREEMLVHGLDELGADTIAVAAAKDLSAMPKSIAHGMSEAMAARAKDPSTPLPAEFPTDPVAWMRRRDFADGGTIPTLDEAITPYDVFSGVRRHLGERYGKALVGPDAPKLIEALLATNEQFLADLDANPSLLDADYVAANAAFNQRFDAHAARLGLRPSSP